MEGSSGGQGYKVTKFIVSSVVLKVANKDEEEEEEEEGVIML